MKKKLDLNGLLAKYEGISNSHSVPFYSPAKNYEYGKDNTVEQDFYQSRQQANWANMPSEEVTYTHALGCNFQMSKSECESFLLRIKDELRNQERQMHGFVENAQKHIHEKFQRNHQKIKKEILELLDRAFKENQRFITEELKRVGTADPPEFIPVHKRIASIEQDINKLLYGLKGADYRKSIAETVLKDFETEIKSLGQNIVNARESYESSLGEVEPDRARIECIREDLNRLFKLSKRNASIAFGAIGNVLGGGGGESRQTNIFGFGNETTKNVVQSQAQPLQSEGEASTRQRKSFFNFVLGS